MTVPIRPLALDEMAIPIAWAAAEGWNPGLNDAEAFHAADPEGFLAAFLDDAPAACISAVRSGDAFGFIGFYICRPDLRGRGIGWRLWQAAMERLAGRTIGLDGVVAQQANYRRSGFVLAHHNIRYAGMLEGSPAGDHAVKPIDAAMIDAVVAYDRPFFPGPREAFLRRWLAMPDSSALAHAENGIIQGYGVIRRARTGWKIGPLFADSPQVADRLFLALAAEAGGEAVILDPPEPNAEAVALAARHGLRPVFETARMYAGPPPDLPIARTFGVTSFELG